MARVLSFLLAVACVLTAAGAGAQDACCTILSMDEKRQAITAIERKTGKLFRFTLKDTATFKSAKVCEAFDAPVKELLKDKPFAADFGKADAGKPCCTMATDMGGAGQALGVQRWDTSGVDVILTELKRTSGQTVTARWQYCNGTDKTVVFKEKGCVGMGCTYTVAEDVHFLDGSKRVKHPVLRDSSNRAIAQRYESKKLRVGAHQVFVTWAKFNAPPESSSKVTFIIPGASEPFEDVTIEK